MTMDEREDGVYIDRRVSDNTYWLAEVKGGKVTRVGPKTEEELLSVFTPGELVDLGIQGVIPTGG
jgi:hypothetical protein